MIKMSNRAGKISFSPLMLAILGIWFLANLLSQLSIHKNPIEGHYMERLWCYIFTRNEPLLDSFVDVIKTKIERFNMW